MAGKKTLYSVFGGTNGEGPWRHDSAKGEWRRKESRGVNLLYWNVPLFVIFMFYASDIDMFGVSSRTTGRGNPWLRKIVSKRLLLAVTSTLLPSETQGMSDKNASIRDFTNSAGRNLLNTGRSQASTLTEKSGSTTTAGSKKSENGSRKVRKPARHLRSPGRSSTTSTTLTSTSVKPKSRQKSSSESKKPKSSSSSRLSVSRLSLHSGRCLKSSRRSKRAKSGR